MSNLLRRVEKLESRRFDASGLVPHSEVWFDFYEEELVRLMDGEDIGNIRIPLEVIDRIVEEADREEQAIAGRRLECPA